VCEHRAKLGLSQRSLARRAGTTQAAVSRIERGLTLPRWDTVCSLLLAMGLEPNVRAVRLNGRWDPVHLAAYRVRTPAERLELAMSANRLAERLRRAGRRRALAADAPLDAERILRVLATHAVDYVIVGGLAVQVHGHVRTTVDIDVLPRPDPGNLARLADALNELDASVLNLGSEDLTIDTAMLPRAAPWQFATPHGAIDVLHEAPGAPPYDELRRGALEVRLGDLRVAVAGRDDLIAMKRASARSVDLEDIAALTEQA
jgi:transcriptional regulator with XRE-family HTH domain